MLCELLGPVCRLARTHQIFLSEKWVPHPALEPYQGNLLKSKLMSAFSAVHAQR